MSTDWIDIELFASLLATRDTPAPECAAALRGYFEEEEGSKNGRAMAKVTAALKARPELLADRLPALLSLIDFTHDGEYTPDKGQRILGALGSPLWNTFDSTRLMDTSRFALTHLMEALYDYSDAPADTARELARWLELGDEAAFERLRPTALAAAADEAELLPDLIGHTITVTGRVMALLVAHLEDPEAKLEALLEAAEESWEFGAMMLGVAAWLTAMEGPATPPPWPLPHWENADDKASRLALLEVLYRLHRDHRPLFETYAPALLQERPWRALAILALLGVVDEERSASLAHGARFWRVLRFGRCTATCWGKVGDAGSVRLKGWASEAAALKGAAAAHRKKLKRPDAADTSP